MSWFSPGQKIERKHGRRVFAFGNYFNFYGREPNGMTDEELERERETISRIRQALWAEWRRVNPYCKDTCACEKEAQARIAANYPVPRRAKRQVIARNGLVYTRLPDGRVQAGASIITRTELSEVRASIQRELIRLEEERRLQDMVVSLFDADGSNVAIEYGTTWEDTA